jgi:hypothetical protein
MVNKINWKMAEERLNCIMNNHGTVDKYLILNVIAPLRQRLYSGERTINLYNEIMNLRLHSLIKIEQKA